MTMQFIASATPSAGTNPIFTNIPQTFTHLQLRIFARSAAASTLQYLYFRFNGDTGNNYTGHYLRGDGTTPSSGWHGTGGYTLIGILPAANDTSGIFANTIVDILDYTSTNKNKTVRSLNGVDKNGSGNTGLWSALWFPSSIAAITQIEIGADSGGCATGSRFDLYGITTSELTGA